MNPQTFANRILPDFSESYRECLTTMLCRICALLLILFACAKLQSAMNGAPILLVPDHVFGISNGNLLLIAGTFEWFLGLSLFWFSRKHQETCFIGIAAFCGAAWFYRYALNQVDPQAVCPCLGTLTQNIGITPAMADRLSFTALGLLSFSSVAGLILIRLLKRRTHFSSSHQVVTALIVAGYWTLSFDAYGGVEQNGSNPILRFEGRILWKGSTNGQPVEPTRKTLFTATIDNCRYRLEETDLEHDLSKLVFSFDGTNWYNENIYEEGRLVTNLVRFGKDGPILTPLKKPLKAVNPSTVTVSQDIDSILPKTTSLLPVWLAFWSTTIILPH